MTVKQFIEKAIEGGWFHPDWTRTDDFLKKVEWRVDDGDFETRTEFSDGWNTLFRMSDAFLDPEAWKAVGKVEGWPPDGWDFLEPKMTLGQWGEQNWRGRMRGMIEALIEGKTIEQYLETL